MVSAAQLLQQNKTEMTPAFDEILKEAAKSKDEKIAGFAGRMLPRSTIQWARASLPIEEGRLQRGDLVFFNTLGASFSHMGIYIGGRQFVHAPSSGKGVRIDSLDKTYFFTRFNGARTVFAA